jgi:hypothetical protein
MDLGSLFGGLLLIVGGLIFIIKRKWCAYMNAEYNYFKPKDNPKYRKNMELIFLILGCGFIILGIIIIFKG